MKALQDLVPGCGKVEFIKILFKDINLLPFKFSYNLLNFNVDIKFAKKKFFLLLILYFCGTYRL